MESVYLHKKQFYIIVAIIIVLLLLLLLTLLLPKGITSPTSIGTTPSVATGPQSDLKLVLSQLIPPGMGTNKSLILVNIDTHGNLTRGAQFILKYDPTVIQNVQFNVLWPDGFYPKVKLLANYVDQTNGRINFAEILPQDSSPVIGRGTLATILFTLSNRIKQSPSNITFFDPAVVLGANQNQNMLKDAQSLTIPKLE